jgi:hypothetical protein
MTIGILNSIQNNGKIDKVEFRTHYKKRGGTEKLYE